MLSRVLPVSIRVSCSRIVSSTELRGMWRRSRLLWVAIIVNLRFCSGGTTPQGDLLTFLINQNEAAWNRIQSLQTIQYTHEAEWLARGEPQPFRGVAQIKKRGDFLWSTFRRTAPDKTTGQIRENGIRLVVNDKYVAQWPATGNPVAYQWDHTSIDEMSPDTKRHIVVTSPYDYLSSCFGTESHRFREATQRNPDRSRYEAVEARGEDGRLLYQIRRFYPKDGPRPDCVWTIDPDKGFLVVDKVFYPLGGTQAQSHATMDVAEVAPEIWYPVGYAQTRYAKLAEGEATPTIESWRKHTIKDIKINEPLPDEQFDFEALGLRKDKPDILVMRTALNGEITHYVYREEGLVPKTLSDHVDAIVKQGLDSAVDSALRSGRPSGSSAARPGRADAVRDPTPPMAETRPSVHRHRLIIILLTSALGILITGAVIVYRRPKPSGSKHCTPSDKVENQLRWSGSRGLCDAEGFNARVGNPPCGSVQQGPDAGHDAGEPDAEP